MVFDPDFADSGLKIGAGERGRLRQTVADHAGEGINLLGRDDGQRHLLLALEGGYFKEQVFLAGFVLVRPIPDHVHIQHAALNCIQKAVLGLLNVFKLGLKFLDPSFIRTAALGDFGAKIIQKAFQIVSRADLLPEGIQDQAFQLFGWNVARWARGVAFAHAVCAFIVSIPTAFARGDGHARAAAIAFQKPRQQMRRSFTAGNAAFRRERPAQLGCLFKENQINDGWNGNLNPFAFWFGSAGLAVNFVEDVQPHISEAGKNLKDLLSAPELAAHKKTAFVQVLGNFLHANTRRVFAVDVECKDFPNNLGLGWINIQFLFQPPMCARASRINCPIAKGSFSPVKISLPRIFIHAAQGVLGVFFALVFVKHHDQMAEKLPHRIVACFLCDRNKINPRFIQPTFIKNGLSQITEKTGIAMDNDRLKRSVFFNCCRNHFLKLWPLVVRCGCARLYIFMGDNVPIALAPFTHLAQLVGNG